MILLELCVLRACAFCEFRPPAAGPTEHSRRSLYRDVVLQQLNPAMPWLLLLMAEDGTGIKGSTRAIDRCSSSFMVRLEPCQDDEA